MRFSREEALRDRVSQRNEVVMLVLVIMLSLPFFQPGMYNDELSSSAQYGTWASPYES